MSLTSHLDDTSSPVRQFIRSHFPNSAAVTRPANGVLRAAVTMRPSGGVSYGTIGTGLDYRLRYYFGITPPGRLIAYQGAMNVGHAGLLPWDVIEGFFANLDRAVAAMQPVRRRLGARCKAPFKSSSARDPRVEEVLGVGCGRGCPDGFGTLAAGVSHHPTQARRTTDARAHPDSALHARRHRSICQGIRGRPGTHVDKGRLRAWRSSRLVALPTHVRRAWVRAVRGR